MKTMSIAGRGAVGRGAGGTRLPAPRGSARTLYTQALARERDAARRHERADVHELRKAVASYESDRAAVPGERLLRQRPLAGSEPALLAYERFGDEPTVRTGLRLLARLTKEYPTSPLHPRRRARQAISSRPLPSPATRGRPRLGCWRLGSPAAARRAIAGCGHDP